MPDEFVIKLVELAPAIAALLYITWRQETRIAALENAILDLLRTIRGGDGGGGAPELESDNLPPKRKR